MNEDQLPAGWTVVTVSDVATVRYGKALPTDRRVKDGFPYVASAGPLSASVQALVDVDVLVIGRKGNVGSVRLVRGGCWPSDTTYYLVPASGLDLEYLAHVLAAARLDRLDQSTAVPGLPRALLEGVRFPLPPIAEQRRIVAEVGRRLSHVSAAREGLEVAQRKLLTARAALLRAAFAGDLTPRERDAWPVVRIGDVFDVYTGSTPSRSDPSLWGGGVNWVSSGEVRWCRIASTRETVAVGAGLRVHPAGTVLLGMIGEGRTRGQAAILEVPAAHNQNCASIRVSDTEHVPEWVYYQLEERYERTRRAGSGNNQQALNRSLVRDIRVVLPPPEVQRTVLDELERRLSLLDSAADVVERQLHACDALRAGILRDAGAGRLVAQDPADEPASELLRRNEPEPAQVTPGKSARKKKEDVA